MRAHPSNHMELRFLLICLKLVIGIFARLLPLFQLRQCFVLMIVKVQVHLVKCVLNHCNYGQATCAFKYLIEAL